jgi:hypothetical protein
MPFGLGFFATTGAGAAAGAYELIQSQVLGTSAASVTFSSIPSSFRHLQIRMIAKTNRTDNTAALPLLNFNSDSGSNYAWHALTGTGSSVVSLASTSTTGMRTANITNSNAAFNANNFGSGVIDILDYVSTAKNTTIRTLGGRDEANNISLISGVWLNTAAVTSLKLEDSGFSFVSGSRFSLYGLRG